MKSNHVPNAAVVEFKTGFAGRHFYVNGYLARQISSSANISAYNQNNIAAFLGSNVNYSIVGINLFAPFYKKFGLEGGLNKYISGRSEGESGGYGAIIYTF